jgi:hypothetical protein
VAAFVAASGEMHSIDVTREHQLAPAIEEMMANGIERPLHTTRLPGHLAGRRNLGRRRDFTMLCLLSVALV